MKQIRVGIIRCDLHAIYYAALMEKHDPLMLRGPDLIRPEMKKYSWLNGGAHFYHYTDYGDPCQMTAPHVDGFTLTKLWDPDREIAEVASKLFYGKPKVCNRFEEVSDDVDMVFIAECNGDGSDHLKLATPGLEKRVPTFVDKPFAYHIQDALVIVALARRRRVPVLSMSILRSLPEAANFSRRLREVGSLSFGVIHGGGTRMAGHIHAISLAQHIFGNGVESTEAMGQNELSFVHLNYGGRKDRPSNGVMLNCDVGPGWHCALSASAYGTEGDIHAGRMSDFEYPKGAAVNLELARKMVRTGKPAVPYEDMLENIAVATAARKAQRTGRTIKLGDVWKR
jgi:predicted dehydrogenase